MTASERQKAYRSRKSAGIRLVPAEMSKEILEAMIYRGMITGAQIHEINPLRAAVREILDDWAKSATVMRNAKI